MKKLFLPLISFLLAMSMLLTGCTNKTNDENKKYDVTIRIKNNYNSKWTFTPDISELNYTFKYTGEKMYFYVDAYNLPKHPRWSDEWFAPNSSGPNVFYKDYRKVNQMYYEEDPKYICEPGEYFVCIEAASTSDIWNFRTVRLYITVI